MKIITKKEIKESPKYMVVIDWKAGKAPSGECFGYKMLDSSDILTAMEKAEAYFTEDTYMIYLLEKTEDTTELGILYSAVLASRTKGDFHRANYAHREQGFWATYNPNWVHAAISYHGMER